MVAPRTLHRADPRPSVLQHTILQRAGRAAHELRDALQQVPGLRIRDGHRASLRCGRQKASVCLESMECIRVALPLEAGTPVRWELQQLLPGNLRFARSAAGLYAVADLQTAPALLAESFVALSWGMAKVAGRRPPRYRPAACPEPALVRTALSGMGWDETDVVERDGGWELRPRLGGRAVAVQVRTSSRGLHLHRCVLESPAGSAETAAAVSDQALRNNARLRWARLTATDAAVIAETTLPAGLVAASHISQAARAVAAAAHHASIPLAVLARAGQVAGRYLDMFVNTPEGKQASKEGNQS